MQITKRPTQGYINHIALVLDASSSMVRHTGQLIKVADDQIAYLARRSKELDQETRITVYTFADDVQCVFYDKDVLRMPSVRDHYRTYGWTALLDATGKALDDLAKTPELYGDHSFLCYVLTDGEENKSRFTSQAQLSERIKRLPDNWTLAAFVPDMVCAAEAKRFGFPAQNVAVWNATSQSGVQEVGETMRKATDAYMTSRAVGVRGTKNLFDLSQGVSNVTASAAAGALDKLNFGQYRMCDVKDTAQIAPFVEGITKRPYRLGEAYYQLMKPEKVQPQKQICVLNKKTKDVYAGKNARAVIGLPDHEVRVAPTAHPDFEIYVQSTSVNRKLLAGTKLILMSTP